METYCPGGAEVLTSSSVDSSSLYSIQQSKYMTGGLPQTLKGSQRCKEADDGFSLIELLIVTALIVVLTAISIPYLYNYQRVYKSEDQALKIMDLMREANQKALNQRHNFRVEIDLTDN